MVVERASHDVCTRIGLAESLCMLVHFSVGWVDYICALPKWLVLYVCIILSGIGCECFTCAFPQWLNGVCFACGIISVSSLGVNVRKFWGRRTVCLKSLEYEVEGSNPRQFTSSLFLAFHFFFFCRSLCVYSPKVRAAFGPDFLFPPVGDR